MNTPLLLRFRIFTLAPKIDVEDANGRLILHVQQKLFRFREKVEVFADASRQTLLATLKADRIIDWSARYTFSTPDGREFGHVGRRGMKSLWRAHYDVTTGTEATFQIQEENPFAKVMDSILGGIPVIGLLAGFFFHPSYLATRPDGSPVMRAVKTRALLEGRFKLDQLDPTLTTEEELSLLLAFLMMALLERERG